MKSRVLTTLIAALAILTTACQQNSYVDHGVSTTQQPSTAAPVKDDTAIATPTPADENPLTTPHLQVRLLPGATQVMGTQVSGYVSVTNNLTAVNSSNLYGQIEMNNIRN